MPGQTQAGSGTVIEVRGLTKRYGDRTAVDDLSFTAPPGQVTGFLGPNGAGKSTTMRMIVGLDAPTGGTALVNGKRYAQHRAPLQELGVLLEAKAVHPGRSAFNHLMALAYTHGVPRRRVDEVIDLAGLHAVAHKRVGAFSLGMGQRLGIAAALLGDPAVVMLDEPVNGLDPEGVRWVRELLRGLAAEGRTVMLSSHLMSEMAQTADRLVVVGRGRLLAETTVDALVEQSEDKGCGWPPVSPRGCARCWPAPASPSPRRAPSGLSSPVWTRGGSGKWPPSTRCRCTNWSPSRCRWRRRS